MPTCNQCGGNEIDFDPARGNAVCVNCGCVLEDSIIVSEVTFADNQAGGTSVVGQFVSAEGSKGYSVGPGFQHGYGRESREVTLTNGRRRIAGLAATLRLNTHHVDAAQQFFKLAVQRNFIQGRKTVHVVAACLYIVCRTEQTPHMLLDFSDILQVNVYVLGGTFLKLCKLLSIKLPIVDPSLFIFRFAHKMEFGDRTHDVAMTALRLVARMKRDWMQVGRRPSGICGAGLLIAARLHGFRRTKREVIEIVRICDITLRKRLEEFEETPSGKLTTQEFQTIDLEEECDPPSFLSARKKHLQKVKDSGDSGMPLMITAAGEDLDKEMQEQANSAGFRRLEGREEIARAASSNVPAVVDTPESVENAVQQEEHDNDVAIDDEELEGFLLNEEEIAVKTKLWTELNKDYLLRQEEKERQEALDVKSGNVKPSKKKKKKGDKTKDVRDVLDMNLQKVPAVKKISQKINYQVLEDLNSEFDGGSRRTSQWQPSASTGRTRSHSSSLLKSTLTRNSLMSPGRRRSSTLAAPAAELGSIGGRTTRSRTRKASTSSADENSKRVPTKRIRVKGKDESESEDSESDDEVASSSHGKSRPTQMEGGAASLLGYSAPEPEDDYEEIDDYVDDFDD
eukprot:Nk52_evm5s272 gene=Nk52_evmTU5s272